MKMKSINFMSILLIILLLQSCKKEDEIKSISYNPNILYGSVSDVEGNIYKTVQIGSQTWMAENIRTTKFNDNTFIPLVTDSKEWSALTTPEYCWYNNDPTKYKQVFGAIYNWYAVNTGKICPTGWHVPSDTEWTELFNYVEGIIDDNNYNNMVCIRLKETGNSHWVNNANATNESGFTAIPGGVRQGDVPGDENDGVFISLGLEGSWWTSSENFNDNTSDNAWYRYLVNDYCDQTRSTYRKTGGMSVRCIKN